MNKKKKLQNELSEAVKREVSSDDCPICRQHFWSALNRDSHKTLYPGHFAGEAQPLSDKKEAAATENLKGRIKNMETKIKCR